MQANSVVKNPTKVYVGSIPRDANEDEIEDMFNKVARMVAFEFKGEFAFVEYMDPEGAEEAIRKLDGKRVGNSNRQLIVERFRYRGGDPRYRRPPPNNVKRGQYRVIVTNLDTNIKAQELRDWAEKQNLNSVTITDVYNRHGMPRNEGVIEFSSRDDFEQALSRLDNHEFGENRVRVFDERDYNRRKLKSGRGGNNSGPPRDGPPFGGHNSHYNSHYDRNDRSHGGSSHYNSMGSGGGHRGNYGRGGYSNTYSNHHSSHGYNNNYDNNHRGGGNGRGYDRYDRYDRNKDDNNNSNYNSNYNSGGYNNSRGGGGYNDNYRSSHHLGAPGYNTGVAAGPSYGGGYRDRNDRDRSDRDRDRGDNRDRNDRSRDRDRREEKDRRSRSRSRDRNDRRDRDRRDDSRDRDRERSRSGKDRDRDNKSNRDDRRNNSRSRERDDKRSRSRDRDGGSGNGNGNGSNSNNKRDNSRDRERSRSRSRSRSRDRRRGYSRERR